MTIARDDVRCAGSREVIPFKNYILRNDRSLTGHWSLNIPKSQLLESRITGHVSFGGFQIYA